MQVRMVFVSPTLEQLKEELGLSKSTVIRVLQELEEQGFIRIEKPTGKDRMKHFHNRYFFLPHECLQKQDHEEVLKQDHEEASKQDHEEASKQDHEEASKQDHEEASKQDLQVKESYKKESYKKESSVSKDTDVDAKASTAAHKASSIHRRNKQQFIPTERSLSLLGYWEGKGLKKISDKQEMKYYKNSLQSFDKLLSGHMFDNSEFKSYHKNKFTKQEICKAITRFALMALNPDYEPRSIEYKQRLAKTSPADFIFNSFKSSEHGYGRSLMLYCLENEPKIIREKDVFVEDDNPALTETIIDRYKTKVMGKTDVKFTNGDINHFRKASNLVNNLFLKNRSRLLGSYSYMLPYQMADMLFNTLEHNNSNLSKVSPSWLCSSVMAKQLPAYMFQQKYHHGSRSRTNKSGNKMG